MLQSTPGALSSCRLEERPASLPTALYVSGGRASSQVSVVVFGRERTSAALVRDLNQLQVSRAADVPLWIRVNGLGMPGSLDWLWDALDVPEPLRPLLVDVPQQSRVVSFEGALLVVLHRLGFARDPSHLISSQLGLLLLPGLLITIDEAPSSRPFEALTNWLLRQEGSRD